MNTLQKKKKTFDFFFFGFAVLGTSDRGRKETQRSKKNNCRKKTQKIGEEGKLENAEEAG